jgi:hypothetical protein
MKTKGLPLLCLLVIVSWVVLKLYRDDVRYRQAINREQKISSIKKDIETIQQLMHHSHDPVTLTSLYDVTQVLQLEGQLRDFQTKNDIELSKSHESTFPEFLPILLLVVLLTQNGILIKQVTKLTQSGSDSN